MERFALLITITVIWAYAHLLTASGAYKHRPDLTQMNCRTDKANLISSAPWLVHFPCIDKDKTILPFLIFLAGTCIVSKSQNSSYKHLLGKGVTLLTIKRTRPRTVPNLEN